MKPFTDDAGRFMARHEADSMTGAYRDRKLSVGLTEDDYVRSEFFGMKQVMQLLSQPGCIGLRVHHAKRWEDIDGKPATEKDGQLKPRVLLTGVDADGKDMPIRVDYAGLKDMPDADNQVAVVGDGFTCPRHCGK